MRKVFLFVILIGSITVKAQTFIAPGFMNYIHQGSFGNNLSAYTGTPGKKWFVTSYSGISTSFNFFNGGNANIIAAPVGIQLNRRLNNNLYAFAGVSVAPAYINFNGSFLSSSINNKSFQNGGFYNASNLAVYSRAELGLQYINDARTFSISGSIGVERSSYPLIPYNQGNAAKSDRITAPRR